MKRISHHLLRAFFALALLLPAVLTGCGDNDNPADPGNGDGDTTTVSGRTTIDSLLSVFFPDAYSNRDSIKYEEMLDDRYSFQKLPDNPDEPIVDLFWDKTEELRIAGKMFDGSTNGAGQSVASITLNIQTTSPTASFDTDQPDDEEWFDVVAIIDLTVVLDDPGGDGILNLLIDSDQKFIVVADSDFPNDWVIVKQEDKDQFGKAGDVPITEETSWSAVKDLFR